MRTTLPVLGLLALAFYFTSPAHALVGINQCGPGIKLPTGLLCGHNDLLLGYRNAAGACVWVCCPPNSDGKTYNCTGNPTPSDYIMDLRSVRPEPWQGVFTPAPAFERP